MRITVKTRYTAYEMIAYYAKRSPGEEFEEISRPIKAGMWVDGAQLTDNEINKIISDHTLNNNIVYDVRDRHELPRVEYDDINSYVFLRVPHLAKSGRVGTLPLLCVLKDDNFFTLSTGESIEPNSVALSTVPITTEQSHTLLLGVVAGCVAKFEGLLQHTSRSVEDTSNKSKNSREQPHVISSTL